MRLEKVSGEGADALYNLFWGDKKIAGPVTMEELKKAIKRLEDQEVSGHDKR